jgi:hypothetical protein
MIKEYIVICKCCGRVVTEEGLAHWRQFGYTDKQICTCDPSSAQYRGLVTIRLDHYGSLFSFFQNAVETAHLDFDDLDINKIEIIHFGGKRYSRTFGIRFHIDNVKTIKLDYERRLFSEQLL